MNEEKSMTEYKEQKGIFQWLKSKFEKLKERLKPKREVKKESQDGQELSEEDLDKVKGGIPLKAVDMEELMADLGMTEPKAWDLTEEEKIIANSSTKQDDKELSEEELDEVKAGFPIVEDEGR